MLQATIRAIFASVALTAAPAFGQTAADHASHHPGTAVATPLSDGEVRKVDKSAGKVTIRHGALPNLDMPAMTMVFRTRDPAMLDKLKEGDKIKFAAEKVGGVYTITAVELSK